MARFDEGQIWIKLDRQADRFSLFIERRNWLGFGSVWLGFCSVRVRLELGLVRTGMSNLVI